MSLHYAREDEVSYIGKDLFFMNSQRLELFVDWLMNDINVSVRNILEAKKNRGTIYAFLQLHLKIMCGLFQNV